MKQLSYNSQFSLTYNLLYKQQFNNEDLGWNNDVDFINNHIEGIILNDFCKFALLFTVTDLKKERNKSFHKNKSNHILKISILGYYHL